MTAEAKNKTIFPTEFEIPTRKITPQEILDRLDEHASSVQVLLDPDGGKISLPEDLLEKVEPKNRQAEAYVLYGKSMEGLNGTYMEPKSFFELFKPQRSASENNLFGSEYEYYANPWAFKSEDGLMVVNVFSGSATEEAKEISRIGESGEFSEANTAVYQTMLAKIFSPITERTTFLTKTSLSLKSSDNLLIDEEDCIATGDTLVGTGRVFGELGMFPWRGRRIDVVTATAQGLTVLYHWARENKIPVEVNVGFLSWGLSQGIGENLAHKNYITHAPIWKLVEAHGKRIFVVGDMGEASKRVSGRPWDSFRVDGYDFKNTGQEYFYQEHLDQKGDLYMGFEKGGLLMVALRKYILQELGYETDFPLIMAVGKRLDLGEHGFGLRLDGFLNPLKELTQSTKRST